MTVDDSKTQGWWLKLVTDLQL